MRYRILLILSVVYRRWASVRLRSMTSWTEGWKLPCMFAGVPGMGAEDAWWSTAVKLARAIVEAPPFSGASLD